MVKKYDHNDTVLGEKLYITYRKMVCKPTKLQTTGRHNAQKITVEGNPATATIIKTLKWVGK